MDIQEATTPYALCYAHSCQPTANYTEDIYRMITLPTTEMIILLAYREAAAITITTDGMLAYVHTTNGRLIPLDNADIPRLEAMIHVVCTQRP